MYMALENPTTTLRRLNLRYWIEFECGKSQAKFIDRTGINQGELSGLLRDKSFGEKKARALEIQAGMPAMWLDKDHQIIGDEIQAEKYTFQQTNENEYSNLNYIKKYDEKGGSMGRGVVLKDQPGQITNLVVTDEWINKNVPSHTGKNNLGVVTGFGDSMKGMFNPGDPLLVDKGVTSCDHDGVFFFRVGDEGFIKRLQRIPSVGIKVISKNTDYETWVISEDMDFEVLAKVLIVWKSEIF